RLPPRSPPLRFLGRSPPPTAPPFPYTTLFRSGGVRPLRARAAARSGGRPLHHRRPRRRAGALPRLVREAGAAASAPAGDDGEARSEEHTSELQSRENLVCRLLLEKKKKKTDRQ